MKKGILRQGDVLLIAVAALPSDTKEEKLKGPLVLAYGEVTGHAHQIKEHTKVRVWSAGAERFIQAAEAVALTHEEHSAIKLVPGQIYRQAHQVEDFGAEVRRVAD